MTPPGAPVADARPPAPRSRPSARTSFDPLARPVVLLRERLFGAFLTSISGIAILVHTFGPMPMSFTVPFVALPLSIVFVGFALARRRRYGRLHVFSDLVIRGAGWGLVATLAYDVVRPALRTGFGFSFDPYRAIWIFGELITGLPRTHLASALSGWAYHFWNGIGFGMTFGLVWPRGGMLAGVVWAELLQALMFVTYPRLFGIRLEDPGFLTLGLVGHGVWGLILGYGMTRNRPTLLDPKQEVVHA